jgi:glutathionylspermidine synthase
VKQIIEENQKTMRDMINEKLTELKSEIQQQLIGVSTQQDNNSEENTVQFADGDVHEEGPEMQGQPQVRYRTCAHSGKYWHVPKNFSFPVGVTLEAGWKPCE